jgi:hypothetical protein
MEVVVLPVSADGERRRYQSGLLYSYFVTVWEMGGCVGKWVVR